MAVILSRKAHESGIALGGIGTGSVELYPDGEFHQWQIYNPPRWAAASWDSDADDGEGHTGDLAFWVRTKTASGVRVRRLGQSTDPKDFTHRMFGWNKPIREIEFDGRFPVAELKYRDPGLPCGLSLRASAPFIPENYEASAMPGCYLTFTAHNPTAEPMELSLLGILDPGFLARTRNTRTQGGDVVYLSQTFDGPKEADGWGQVCLASSGAGDVTAVAGDYSRFLREYVGNSDLGVTQESLLFSFRDKGFLQDSRRGMPVEIPETLEELKALSEEELEALTAAAMDLPSCYSVVDRVKRLKPDYPACREDRLEFLKACAQMTRKMGGSDAFGGSALCRSLTLAPGETREVRFILAWYFPNHKNPEGVRLGHYYENLVSSAQEAACYLAEHRSAVEKGAALLRDRLFNTTLPLMYPESWSAHLSTLVKSSWWLKDGRFGLWEGLGYCGFHTTDVSYHATFGLASLFPRLQLRQMEMTAEFQLEDGRVPHCFCPDLHRTDDSFERVDMNLQYVLMTARDYRLTGDRESLKRAWGPICKALDQSLTLDGDGDGLPDRGTCRNTYDSWNFSGCPSYLSLLWLGALRAGSFLAERLGDETRRDQWQALLQKGSDSLEQKLWNGAYYDLWAQGDQRDGALMTDQLDGEWFLRMIGMPGNLPDSRVQSVLREILNANFDPEAGLINASCPEGHPTTIDTYRNCQAGACWSGIAYITAALAASVGMRREADLLVRTVNDLHEDLGYIWNHWECGFRYTRPLSSFTTLLAFSGVSVDREAGELRLEPKALGTFPVFLPGAVGSLKVGERRMELCLEEGSLPIRTLILPQGAGQIRVNGVPCSACTEEQQGRTLVRIPEELQCSRLEVIGG